MMHPVVVNAGCGPVGSRRLPAMFDGWRQIRVDVDPGAQPDLLSSITDLSAIPSGSVDAVWSSHCVEHLFAHDVSRALSEFFRVLAADGFACVIVPDLQAVAEFVATDRLTEVLYESGMGPVTAHDILFGFGPALAEGQVSMAHRCGFTPTTIVQRFSEQPFDEVVVRRRACLELAAVARRRRSTDAAEREALLTALEV